MIRAVLMMFVALADSDMRWMAEHGSLRALTPGQTLISRGEQLNGLLIILSGSASVVRPGGKTLTRRAGELSWGGLAGRHAASQRHRYGRGTRPGLVAGWRNAAAAV